MSDDRLDTFLARLDAALRARPLPPYVVDTVLFGAALRDGAARWAHVTFEGHARDARGVVVRYRLRATPETAAARAAWRRAQARWQRSPSRWTVTTHDAGLHAVVLRETYAELAQEAQWAGLGGDAPAPEALPEPVVAPCALRVALSDEAVRLALTLRRRPRLGSVVPYAPLVALLDALPGWQWAATTRARPWDGVRDAPDFAAHPAMRALPTGWRLTAQGDVQWFWRTGGAPATDADRDALRAVFGAMPADGSPGTAPVGAFLASSVAWAEPAQAPSPAAAGTLLAVRDARRVTVTTRITAPSGAAYALDHAEEARRAGVVRDAGFWGWAVDAGLLLDADAALGSVGACARHRALRTIPRDLRNLGECQICGWYWKLRFVGVPGTRVLVEHGYHYPDSEHYRGGVLGERAGHCAGVGHVPYEKGHDALDALLPSLRVVRDRAREALAHVESMRDALVALSVPLAWTRAVKPDERGAQITVEPTSERWLEFLARRIDVARAAVEAAEDRVQWCEARITSWTLRPLYDEPTSAGST